jgi:hypothetical protein
MQAAVAVQATHSFEVANAGFIEVPRIHQHRFLGTAAAAGGTAAGTSSGTATCCRCRLCQHAVELSRLDMPGASWQQQACGISICVSGTAAAAIQG